MKRLLLLFLSLSLLLSGCGKLEDNTPYDPLDELRDYYGTDETVADVPLTTFTLPYCSGEPWDPFTCPDGVQRTVTSLVYETLFVLNETFTPQPLLVSSVSYDAEKFLYTLSLRSDVCFSDGSAMTAQDVAASLLRALHSERYGGRLYQVATVTVAGDAVQIRLTEDNRAFTALLDIPVVRTDTENDALPVGTGPYLPAADLSCLVLSENWWQQKTLPFDTIALRPYKSEEAATYAFSSHDVNLLVYDLLSEVGPTSASNASATTAETGVMHYLGFNGNSRLLSDPALRRAISLAVDREEIADAVLSGHAVATQFPVHPASPLYPTQREASTASTAAVNAALAQRAEHSAEPPYRLQLVVNEDNGFKVSAAESIAVTLARYGFEITVTVLPWEDFLYALQVGNYDLYYGECRLSADWDMAPLLSATGSMNFTGYASDEMESLLAEARSAEGDARSKAIDSLCRHLQADAPIAPLYFERLDVLVSRGTVDAITPTAVAPFYGLEHWQVNWSEETNE